MSKCATSLSAMGVPEGTATSELDWRVVVGLHEAALRLVIQRRVDASSVDDVLQETYERALRNQDSLDPDRDILPWLVRIATRAATDARRRQRPTAPLAALEQPCEESGYERVDEKLVSPLKRRGIDYALNTLNGTQRRVLTSVANGASCSEVAAAENMSTNAVRCVTTRARTNFRASYFGFGRGLELFGGAVGGVLLKLRLRLQRYQDFVNGHATAFGVATVAVVAVGVAAYPVARPIATQALEDAEGTSTSIAVDAMNIARGAGDPSSAAVTAGSSVSSSAGDAESRASSPALPIGVVTDTAMNSDDATFSSEATTVVQTETAGVRNVFGYEVDCTRGTINAIECHAIDTVSNP